MIVFLKIRILILLLAALFLMFRDLQTFFKLNTMKKILPILITFCCLQSNYSQVNYLKGILLKDKYGYSSGDTLVFFSTAIRKNNSLFFIDRNQYMYPEDEIRLTNETCFWDRFQFIFTKNRNNNSPVTNKKRSEMEKQTKDYLSQLETDNKYYKDYYIEDYLQQLLQRVHYPRFNMGGEKYFNVKILNDATSACYPFANGTILLTTQLIADTDSESKLFEILTEAVGYILFDKNYENEDSFSGNILKNLGAIGSGSTNNQLSKIAENFFKEFETGKSSKDLFLSRKDYYNQIAGIISYTAWQEYYSQNYNNALNLLKKLRENDIATDEDCILMSRIYRKISNTPESNHEALLYLQKAVELNTIGFPEVYAELGLTYIRLSEYSEASGAFKKYEEALVNGSGSSDDMKWCKQMIYKCSLLEQNMMKNHTEK